MSFVLGIDTGGTYTDGVIVDRERRQIVSKAKSLTTREDLSIGISDVIRKMDLEPSRSIDFVALSTTLATNAIVEGRGCEVGLILIGHDQQQEVPAAAIEYVSGGHDIRGREKAPLDEDGLRAALDRMRGKVDALAISSYLSVRNPEHELAARQIAEEALDLPIVCGHHLTRSLGVKERSVTALLNARLIPIIDELIRSVKASLSEVGVDAPIMIVKGDGSLMGERQARERPIETILSGPAASIIGANFLAHVRDGMVLDMGGTTSDIAVLRDGMPKIDREGARGGGWLTRVEAAEIDTYGLGGDSHIWRDANGRLQVGPRRVWPVCVLCHQHPHLLEELSVAKAQSSIPLIRAQPTDCFILLNEHVTAKLSDEERGIIDALRDGPHSLFQIAARIECDVNQVDPVRLVTLGALGHISFTPTDALHALKRYADWSMDGARLAAELMAERAGMDVSAFLQAVVDRVAERLAYVTWQSLLNQQGTHIDLDRDPLFAHLSRMVLAPQDGDLLIPAMVPKMPIIGIGAPVRAWLPDFAERIGAKLILPEHTEVANAVGAAVGRVMEVVKILITPGEGNLGYVLYSRWERRYFEDLEEAVAYGKDLARTKAEVLARESGAADVDVILEHRDVYASTNNIKNDIYIESHIEAIGAEKTDWL